MSYLNIIKAGKTFSENFGKSILLTKPVKSADLVGLKLAPGSCTDTFVSTIKSNTESFASRIRALSKEGFESETLEKLYTAKFKPKRRFNEQGFPVTTLIDRKTGEPVEAYIKDLSKGDDKCFRFFIEGDDMSLIGSRTFSINRELGQLEPGFMTSLGNDRYAGIGLRGHQLAVEEAIINGYDTICLESLPQALKFHKKSLYVPSKEKKISLKEFEDTVKSLANDAEISEAEAIKYLPHRIENGTIILRTDVTLSNVAKLLNKELDTFMELSGERLKLWQDMAKSQPILLP